MNNKGITLLVAATLLTSGLVIVLSESTEGGSSSGTVITIDSYEYDGNTGKITCSGIANTPFVNIQVKGDSFTSVLNTASSESGSYSVSFTIAGASGSQNALMDGIYQVIVKYVDYSVSKRFVLGDSFVIDSVSYSDGLLCIKGISARNTLSYIFDDSSAVNALFTTTDDFSVEIPVDLFLGEHIISIFRTEDRTTAVCFEFTVSEHPNTVTPSDPAQGGDESGSSPIETPSNQSSGNNPSQGGNNVKPDDGSFVIDGSPSQKSFDNGSEDNDLLYVGLAAAVAIAIVAVAAVMILCRR